MFDISDSLRPGLNVAQDRLRAAQGEFARASTASGGRASDAAMANVARSAIFTEALLGAMHARFSELKAVTK